MSKIKFVRKYDFYGETVYDVLYDSNRLFTYFNDKLPKNVVEFINSANTITQQHNGVFSRDEILYEVK